MCLRLYAAAGVLTALTAVLALIQTGVEVRSLERTIHLATWRTLGFVDKG